MRTLLALLTLTLLPVAHAQTDDDAELRAARWQDLQTTFFGDHPLHDGNTLMQMDAPARALDAATVPIGLTFTRPVKAVHLIIDGNPAPLAGHFAFGPNSDARSLKLRVRIDQYTPIHAVAETPDGKLYMIEKFVKASGGCSAPAGPNNDQTLAEMGRMKLKLQGDVSAGQPLQAQLMIRHPNFNGMQMDQVTHYYTPAHFIRSIDVSYEGERVFRLDADISLSTDPVITFGFVPKAKGQMKVIASDSKDRTFQQSFDIPQGTASDS